MSITDLFWAAKFHRRVFLADLLNRVKTNSSSRSADVHDGNQNYHPASLLHQLRKQFLVFGCNGIRIVGFFDRFDIALELLRLIQDLED